METFSIILLIYIIIIFINFIYINRYNYQRIDSEHTWDIFATILASPIFLLYNLSKYWVLIKLPKSFKKSKLKYTWWFRWWDLVTDNEWNTWIYLWTWRIIYEWDISCNYIWDINLSIQYRTEVSEELAMLDEAQKLQKKANELLAKKKKTIYN